MTKPHYQWLFFLFFSWDYLSIRVWGGWLYLPLTSQYRMIFLEIGYVYLSFQSIIYDINQNFFSTIPSLTVSNVDFSFLFLLLKFFIFRIFLQSCQLKMVDYLFRCNVLKCGVCLGCNFLVDSCSNALFLFSFWNMHTMCLTKCVTHCCISFK